MEVLVSGKEMKGDQAEGTGVVPVPEATESKREGQTVETGEPFLEADRSGEEPDLMEVDQAVRTGAAPVREVMEEKTGAEPVLEEAMEETLCPFGKQGRVIFTLRITPEMTLIRWGSSHLRKPPKHHLPLNNLQKHPPVLNNGRRGSKL